MTDTQGNEQVEEKLPPAVPTETKPAESNEGQLPDGVSDRTKEEFEKLKAHNSELKKELDAYKGKTSVLDEFKPKTEVQVETPNLSTTQVAEIQSKFVDKDGFVDVAALEKALTQADERAKRAEEAARRAEQRIQDSEESAKVKAAHAEFPQLDPHSDSFDEKFYKLVKLNLVDQMMNGSQDIVKAAKEVSELYHPVDVQKAKTEAVTEYKTKVSKRDQASEGVSAGKGAPTDIDELRKKTQAGDADALYKRLQASGN